MGSSAFKPSNIPVPGEQEYTKGAPKKSYSDLLLQGVNRAQDGRGKDRSEFDARSLGRRVTTTSAQVPSDADEAGQVSKGIPVASTGRIGVLPGLEKGYRQVHANTQEGVLSGDGYDDDEDDRGDDGGEKADPDDDMG